MAAAEENLLSMDAVANLRIDYVNVEFSEQNLAAKDPIQLFDIWFKEAVARKDIPEANAMTLSTCGADRKPLSRVVLMKGYDARGFRFFSNYESKKGKAMQENPNVCISFFWEPLHRQVLIQGVAEKLSENESTDYFHSRPRGSQIGALVSKQSTVIAGRHVLLEREEQLKGSHGDEASNIPKPNYWGGYLVRPTFVEFWSGRQCRLHDRIAFRQLGNGESVGEHTYVGENGWAYERLSP